MNTPTRRVLVAATATSALAVLATGLASADHGDTDRRPPPEAHDYVRTWTDGHDGLPSRLDTVTAPGTLGLEFVGFADGCRVVDTRRDPARSFAAGEARDYPTRDGDLATPFGHCGVPDHAVAVEVSLSTISGTTSGRGYARLGPGGSVPSATVLQWASTAGVSVTTSTGLDAHGRFRLHAHRSAAGFAVDLLGYWRRPVWGLIDRDGDNLGSEGIVAIDKSITQDGLYMVTADRAVFPHCSATATPYGDRRVRVVTWDHPHDDDKMFFETLGHGSTSPVDGTLQFQLVCSGETPDR